MVGSHPHIHPIAALGPTAHGGGAQGCAVPLWDLGGGGGGMLWGREGQPPQIVGLGAHRAYRELWGSVLLIVGGSHGALNCQDVYRAAGKP